jgi:hypothetical protein
MMKFTTLVRLGAGAWSETFKYRLQLLLLAAPAPQHWSSGQKTIEPFVTGLALQNPPKKPPKNLPEKTKKKTTRRWFLRFF